MRTTCARAAGPVSRAGARFTMTACGLALAAAAAAPAQASFPGPNGEISYGAGAWSNSPTSGWQALTHVWVGRPDGGGLRQLTDGPAQDASGRWSPDGSQLIFARQRPPGGDLPPFQTLRIDAQGGPATAVLTNCAGECRFASWHPDGAHLIVSMGTASAAGIWSVEPDGSGERLLVAEPGAFKAVMSPDASKIAYVVSSAFPNPSTVMVANADGSGAHRIAYGNSPDWSPDSTRIAYQSGDSEDGVHTPWIMVSDIAGSQRVPAAPGAGLFEDSPSWSPDGSEIVFTAIDVNASDAPILPTNNVVVVRAPVGAAGQHEGASTAGCLRGYRLLLRGVVGEPHWGSHAAAGGAGGHPADVPCPRAPAPPAVIEASPALRTTIARRSGELRVVVRLAKGAKGRLTVRATMRGHALRRRATTGSGARRTYRFAVRRSGTAVVTARFAGRAGWASASAKKRKVHVRP
jgi:Tol biopolymer transport system component